MKHLVQTYRSYVFEGFLYFFGLSDLPQKKIVKNMRKRSDAEAMRQDINKISHDLIISYERETKKYQDI